MFAYDKIIHMSARNRGWLHKLNWLAASFSNSNLISFGLFDLIFQYICAENICIDIINFIAIKRPNKGVSLIYCRLFFLHIAQLLL